MGLVLCFEVVVDLVLCLDVVVDLNLGLKASEKLPPCLKAGGGLSCSVPIRLRYRVIMTYYAAWRLS